MDKLKLLIVDDEENMRHMLTALLERHGYEIAVAEHGEAALGLVAKHQFDFILCDVKMPKMDGLQFLEAGKELLSDTTVIMMSAFGTVDLAIDAMKAGAYDFISKPFKSDEVLMTLKKAEEREQLRRENLRLREKIEEIEQARSFERMIGSSEPMQRVFALARQIAVYDTTVLITGASGTGKEMIAHGIHNCSSRSAREMVAVDCSAIPENLLESELFGHVRGAFTGAQANRKGLFEIADGSTIFLDEIGELSLTMQVKLLRILQEREIRPVGSSTVRKVDVRVLAATARDLQEEVGRKTFREDLYYRLNVMTIHLPPLRERTDDLAPLADHFIRKFNRILNLHVEGISAQAMKRLLAHHWPGNVRELENVIQRAMVLAQDRLIEANLLPEGLRDAADLEASFTSSEDTLSLKTAQKQLEKKLIGAALERFKGNKSKAARALEISYPSLLHKIKEYDLNC